MSAGNPVAYAGRDATITRISSGYRVAFRDPDLPACTVERWTQAVALVLRARVERAIASKGGGGW